MDQKAKDSFIMEIEHVSNRMKGGAAIAGKLKNGVVTENAIVYANGMPYTVASVLRNKNSKNDDKNKSMLDCDIILTLSDAQPDDFAIGDIVSTNKDISLGSIPSNIYDKSSCDFCGSKLTMEGKLYVCDRCGAVFNRKEIEG